jgi:hypothetical protein
MSLRQFAHALITAGVMGGTMSTTVLSLESLDLKSEASVHLRFLVKRSFLECFFSEDDDCCLSDLSDLLFLSFGLVKDGGSRPSCLA